MVAGDVGKMLAKQGKMASFEGIMKLNKEFGSAYRIRTGGLVLERDAS